MKTLPFSMRIFNTIFDLSELYTISHINIPYLYQILTDIQNSFIGTLYRKLAIKKPLQILSQLKGVATLYLVK